MSQRPMMGVVVRIAGIAGQEPLDDVRPDLHRQCTTEKLVARGIPFRHQNRSAQIRLYTNEPRVSLRTAESCPRRRGISPDALGSGRPLWGCPTPTAAATNRCCGVDRLLLPGASRFLATAGRNRFSGGRVRRSGSGRCHRSGVGGGRRYLCAAISVTTFQTCMDEWIERGLGQPLHVTMRGIIERVRFC